LNAVDFGRYRLLEVIGQGGMGKVYKAYDTVIGRDVAIKVLSADLANEQGFRERFRREALTAARLTEPHIIPIYDSNEIDGQLYLVMPLIDGIDISTALKRDGPMSPRRAVRVIEQLAAALDAAHAHRLVHRDVKPSNAMMADHEFVYLIDFGIAHDAAAAKLTRTGENPGTYAYMAPERFKSGKVDARADIYALSCVLHECLTTSPPFSYGTDAQLMAAHLAEDPPRPSQQRRGVPAAFDDVIARGMAKQPDQRFQSAGDLAVAARAALTTPLHEQADSTPHRSQVVALAAQTAEALPTQFTPQTTWPPTDLRTPMGMAGIRRDGIGAASFPWPPTSRPDRPPYLGWEPFEPIDAGVFFGRDAELVRAVEALRGMRQGEETLFVVLGASGAGKSCFLRAGIVPRLQEDNHSYLVLDIVRPELKALTGASGLAQAICATRQRFGLTQPPLGDIKDACTRGDIGRLRAWLIECRDAATGQLLDTSTDEEPLTIVLPLDQAEELFTGGAGEEAAGLLALVRDLALGADGQQGLPLIVAAAIRTDRYELMQTAPQLAGLQTKQFDLRPMDSTQFNSVITGPAQRSTDGGRPLYLDEELVRRLLTDASGGADTLPLLSLTLAWLYRDYGSTGRLTLQPYAERGGIGSVVHAEIDELLSSDSDERAEQLKLLRTAFIPWLATINPDNDQPMRRLARWDDLPDDSRPLLERFIARRLLIKDRRGGVVVVEVALESLLRQWDDLAAWLAEEREDLKAADTLERSAAEWDKHRRDDAWLLHGTRLADAENLAAKPGFRDRLNPTRDYLLASLQRENERAELEKQRQRAELQAARDKQEIAERYAAALRKRSRILITVLAVTVVIAVAAVILGVLAVKNQQEATAQRLVAEGMFMLADQRPGGEVQGIQQLLAGRALVPKSAEAALPDAVAARRAVVKIMQAPSTSDTGIGVESVAISPDGRRIASGTDGFKVRLWDADTGKQLKELKVGERHPAWGVAFSPNGKLLATASGQQILQLWDANTGDKIVEPIPHSAQVYSVAFAGDSQWLVTGSADGAVRVWEGTTRKEGAKLAGHKANTVVRSVSFSFTGDRIVSGGDDKTVRLWDAHSGQQIAEAQTENQVLSVAFSLQGDRIVTGRYDGTIQVLDGRNLQPLGDAFTAHSNAVNSVAFSPDGTRIASGSADNMIKVWDAQARTPIGSLTGHQGQVSSVVFNRDGTRIVSGSADGSVRVWDAVAGLPIPTGQGLVRTVAFSNDGQMASGGDDGTVRLWDARTAKPIGQPLGDPSTGTTHAVNSVAFSPDSSRIVSAARDGSIRLWDLKTRQSDSLPMPMLQGAGQLPPSADLAEPRTSVINSVAFSPDGSWIVFGGDDGTVRLWNGHGQPIKAVVAGYPVWSVAFSPNNQQVVTGEGDSYKDRLQLWDVPSLNPRRPPMVGHDGWLSYSVGFSPDGQRIVSGSNDGTVRVWNTTTGHQIKEINVIGNMNRVKSVAFSHNGRWIVAGDTDNALRLWDAGQYQPIGSPLAGHQGFVQSVAFSPNDRWILSGSKDGTMQLWFAPSDFAQALCSKLNANMSHKQWKQWVSPLWPYIKVCGDLDIAPDQ
jgi:WD40 repeat protein/tRNA A-37 threonylcarbamoyl transferase component Bud32